MLHRELSTAVLVAVGAFALGMASYATAGLIPMIETELSVSVSLAAQLVTAFTLAYGLGSPLLVAVLPAHCQRIGLLGSLAVFVIANVASALANDIATLVVLRAVAGIGAGVYLALGIAAAASLAGEHRRGKAIAIVMGGMASGTVLGVPVSLLLAERLGWQAAFWLIAMLGGVTLLGMLWRLPTLPDTPSVSMRSKLAVMADRRVVAILGVSLLAAIASLGMYTFIAPFVAAYAESETISVTPFLWVWGIGGVVGSFLVGAVVDRVRGPKVTLGIMLLLATALILLPVLAPYRLALTMLPLVVWGAVGWALQVPQNDELFKARSTAGDGHLAIALNESALYLGSAIGSAVGGVILAMQWPVWGLAVGAAAIAMLGAVLQCALVVQEGRRVREVDAPVA
ncbi:MFS transporter [Halomonas elongata]|uniref:MFS transporter n=1 Tax=Halomonas elongata TaxID=2746 RepID=UPI00255AE22C|nr:MFS transporter [Halomonas elongata]MDL4862739.1 MFS transporter [Halomonas elongata]